MRKRPLFAIRSSPQILTYRKIPPIRTLFRILGNHQVFLANTERYYPPMCTIVRDAGTKPGSPM